MVMTNRCLWSGFRLRAEGGAGRRVPELLPAATVRKGKLLVSSFLYPTVIIFYSTPSSSLSRTCCQQLETIQVDFLGSGHFICARSFNPLAHSASMPINTVKRHLLRSTTVTATPSADRDLKTRKVSHQESQSSRFWKVFVRSSNRKKCYNTDFQR